MDFKSLLSQLDHLNEATTKTKTGLKHTAEPGGYGRKDDEDEEGNKVKTEPTEKRGKGRPKKATQTSGEDKKYDFSAFGVKSGKDVKLPKYDKKKTTKHSLKEYFDQMESALSEAGLAVQPIPTSPQQKQQQQMSNKPSFLIKDPANPTMPAITTQDPAVVQAAKNGTMSMQKPGAAPTAQGATPAAGSGSQVGAMAEGEMDEADYSAKSARAGKDIGKPGKAFSKIAKSAGERYGSKAAGERVAGAVLAKLRAKTNEAEVPTHDGDMGAGLGAGRSQNAFEGKKPDFLDLDKDGNKKESMKKAAQDKKKVKESMNENLLAARLKGKHDGLKGHSHCGKNYEDMEEARCYHEGYKEGLDECYGQMPIAGGSMVGEMGHEVENMASYGARTPELDEMDKTSYMKQQAIKTPGNSFKAFGQTFSDSDVLDEFAFEALDNQLNALLESKEDVAEGMTVSISKGQQGAPDSVSVSAQDGEADQLLSIIKSAGLGLFGGEEPSGYGAPQGGNEHGGISVVDDHEGMMALMKKLAGGGEEVSGGDYEDEEGSEEHGHEGHEHTDEEACNECGMAYESCGCDHGDDKEVVDEVESEDQQLYNVAEDNPPDNGSANSTNDEQGNAAANQALATSDEEENADDSEEEVSEAEDETGEEAGKEKMNEGTCKKCNCNPCKCETMSESSFFNLYKKLAMLSEESTTEKDDKAEKAGKKVAKDIEDDEGHKGKDDDKAEKAGKKVKKDIEYDDKKDEKEKVDESYANSADDTFEADIDFMMNIISGGLNKRKSTGQTTIPVVASQLNRTVSPKTTDITESKMLNESVSDWKKLAGI
jgi:hypothetical protein